MGSSRDAGAASRSGAPAGGAPASASGVLPDAGAAAPGGVIAIAGAGETGLACAEALAPDHRVLLGAHTPARLPATLERLGRLGIDATCAPLDVTDPASVRAFAAAAAELGPLVALISTAGLSRSQADGRRIMAVNHVGTALLLDAFLAAARPGSVAVCVASIGGHRAQLAAFDEALLDEPTAPDFLDRFEARLPLRDRPAAAYDLSKRGVTLLARERAAAWGERGARVVSVSPGVIDTEMGRREGGADAIANLAALGRIATPAEVAATIALLCSPAAAYVTGCDLLVDGGTLAGIAHQAPAEARAGWERLR